MSMRRSGGFTLIEVLIVLAIIGLLSALTFSYTNRLNQEEGMRAGQISSLSKPVAVDKPWVGSLDRRNTLDTAPFEFLIEDAALATRAQEYLKSQTEVVVSYRGSRRPIATSIEPAGR